MLYKSPWLHQLNRTRPVQRLYEYQRTDVVVVGAGISGTVTAYHILRDTPYKVILVDAGRVGHGASGKNAGMMIADIERPLKELVELYGEEMVKKGIAALEKSWDILEKMQEELELKTPIFRCSGHYGFADFQAFLSELDNFYWRKQAGLSPAVMLVSEESDWSAQIPERYEGLWKTASQQAILDLLEHKDTKFQAMAYMRMGCGNSALLSEEIVQKMMTRFGHRFNLYEDTHVTEVTCGRSQVNIRAGAASVDAKKVVLCTNGFEKFHIRDVDGTLLDPKFHTLVQGEIGYMEGFLLDEDPKVQGFAYINTNKPSEDPYVYISRRPFEFDTKPKTLVCVGGSEYILPDPQEYDPDHQFPEHIDKEVKNFIAGGQQVVPVSSERAFRWHGLMGYTPNRVRCIGFEPCQPSLLYNLGCNGLGLMPSMYGGWKIAQLLIDKDDDVRLFDPQDRRCMLPKR